MSLHRFWHVALIAFAGAIGATSLAHADWTACQSKPTRACILEEAFSRDGVPLAGKERLDVLVAAGAHTRPEYVTSADIAEARRLAQSANDFAVVNYALLAIRGLVATHQVQQATDLVGSFGSRMQYFGISELARDLARAGDVDAAMSLADRLQLPPDPLNMNGTRRSVTIEVIKTLAGDGKIEQALALMAEQPLAWKSQQADMQAALGQAYAKRGDAKSAKDFFDLAANNLRTDVEMARTPAGQLSLRFDGIRVMALRGDGEAVKAALRQLRAEPDDAQPNARRRNGYHQIMVTLLETRQFQLAIDIARSLTPENERDETLAGIASSQAANDRADDARATLALLSGPGETLARSIAQRGLAGATARAGDVAGALEIVGQIKDPTIHAAALFMVAQALPQ